MNRRMLRALLTAALGISALVCTANADCIGGAVTTTDVNLRSGAGTDNAIIETLPSGTAVIVESDNGGWYRVNYGGTAGYMSSEYLSFSSVMELSASGSVSGTDVNLRSGPDTSSSVVRVTAIGEQVKILGVSGSWYRVSTADGEGYIRSDYVSLSAPGSAQESGSSAAGSSVGEQIVAFARQLLGTPYVWSEETPEEGFDCSGLVSYCFKSFGYSTNRTAATLFENGTPVEKGSLQPGDAVFFRSDSSGTISHVGLYIGDGQFIHASSSAGKVIITDLDQSYYDRNYVGARRIAQ